MVETFFAQILNRPYADFNVIRFSLKFEIGFMPIPRSKHFSLKIGNSLYTDPKIENVSRAILESANCRFQSRNGFSLIFEISFMPISMSKRFLAKPAAQMGIGGFGYPAGPEIPSLGLATTQALLL